MKKLLLCISLFACGYSLIAQTTQQEYNYMSKGYKIEIESGLDHKQGYQFWNVGSHTITTGNANRTCQLILVQRMSDKKIAGTILTFRRIDNNNPTSYICIPSYDANQSMWSETYKYLYSALENNFDAALALLINIMQINSAYIEKNF